MNPLILNHMYHGDAETVLKTFPDECIDLVVTSPPYNVGQEYEEFMTEDEYTLFLTVVFKEIRRVLKSDGRICWNVPYQMYTKRMPHEISQYFCSLVAIKSVGLKFRDTIAWSQLNSENDTAWGSWKSASSPWLRHMMESIIIAYKDSWKKQSKGMSDISGDEFMEYTRDLWKMSTARRKGHPAPFPEELPYRCMKLFSYVDDVVLDPFMGSGTTALVALKNNRRFVGIDYKQEYVDLALKRINAWLFQRQLSDF